MRVHVVPACLPAARDLRARWIASRRARGGVHGRAGDAAPAGRPPVRVGFRLVREPGGFIPAGACGSRAVELLGGEDERTRIGARLIALSAASPGTAILSLSLSRSGTNDCRLVW